jgi:retinol dehydrogenase-12
MFSKPPKCPKEYLQSKHLSEQTAVITGGSSGIGLATAKILASTGMKVHIACKSYEKAKKAIEEIKKEVPNAKISSLKMDLSSLASVQNCVNWIKQKQMNIDVLVNNAGMTGNHAVTAEGVEIHFGVNHLGHFYFTNLLLDNLKNARIINVSSTLHTSCKKINYDDLKTDCKKYYTHQLYAQSKLANILFTKELQRRLSQDKNFKGGVYAVHPGVITTNLNRNTTGFAGFVWKTINWFANQTPEDGAQTVVYCAVAPNLEGGEYYANCAKATPSKLACDPEEAKKLWEFSEKLCGMKK